MRNWLEVQYHHLLDDLLEEGNRVADRTNTGTLSKFGHMIRCDLSEGFPLMTSKKINFNLVAGELLWFLNGKTDLPSLRKYQNKPENSHTIWSDDFEKFKKSQVDSVWYEGQAKDKYVKVLEEKEELGRIYGSQLRRYIIGNELDNSFIGSSAVFHDQLATLIDNIKAVKDNPNHPMARRLRCTFWNPYDHTVGDKKWCALPACHTDFQCLVRDGKLNISFSMRSSDAFLGLPYNIASYGLLCHILAEITELEVGELIYFGNDVHLYLNHVEQAKELLTRSLRKLPKIVMPKIESLKDLENLTGEDFKLEGYDPHGFIKAPQAS
tara:strand:- start:1697 stop:2668 length:972 start_codon:yes stop_codon:yes gene_type:complete